MTVEAVDYFSNHRLKLRFPWSLYHRPIVSALRNVLAATRVRTGSQGGGDVLNLGSGPFFELADVERAGLRFTLCDIDPRAIALAAEIHGSAITRTDVVAPGATLPYADQSFDAVVSMDVVEHVPDPTPWLREALRVLKPGGVLFLTTPNYASVSLRWIENTVLEAVARVQGFSRKELHPTKLTATRLTSLLTAAGATQIEVCPIALGWVLASTARK